MCITYKRTYKCVGKRMGWGKINAQNCSYSVKFTIDKVTIVLITDFSH